MSVHSPASALPDDGGLTPSQRRTRRDSPRDKLRRFLRSSFDNLVHESRRSQPKSILAQARDLVRNLPDILGAIPAVAAFEREREICNDLDRKSREIVGILTPLVDRKVNESELALDNWGQLREEVERKLKNVHPEAEFRGDTTTPDVVGRKRPTADGFMHLNGTVQEPAGSDPQSEPV